MKPFYINPNKNLLDITIKISIALLTLTYLIIDEAAAQTIPRITLSGYVTDDSTHAPLEGVNVFLNNTTLGAATNRDGYYYINNVPFGSYELVVSMMGYQMQKKSITVTQPVEQEINIKLNPKVLRFQQVEIVGPRLKNWRKNLKKFEKFFLGISENSSKCKIINPEILDFQVNKVNGDFSAEASDWLNIENQALGYRILFNMKKFTANDNGKLEFFGEAQFKELTPENQEVKQSWVQNRLRAYHGSLRHFLRALASQNLETEGFLIYKSSTPKWGDIIKTDLQQPDPADLIDSVSTLERKISFEGYMKVIYKNELEEKNYFHFRLYDGSQVRKILEQTSWIKFPYGSVTINTSGIVVNSLFSIETYGYWAWERFAELLPRDYQPPDIPNNSTESSEGQPLR